MNLPLIGAWVQLLKVPYRILYPAILLFCCVGVYSVQNSIADVLMAAGFGVVGYCFRRFGCDPAPLMLGLVLGPMMEERSEEHTSELQSLMRISYAVFCLKKKQK